MSPQAPGHRESEEVLRILREIRKSPEMTQRELSSRLGISLGKVNFLVNALIQRGMVKVENFRTSTSKKAYLYYLTPRGIEEKTRTTYQFLKRKLKEYESLEEEIRQLREEVRTSGVTADEQDRIDNRL
ncbi:MAG: MarR family EPS-associated transcriptional regulator [Deltaproteobacteria bacterium RBG_13_53_10]|nr:MAG: MarR family EPS-associated transcriptional regulator [Deltaproteobacteria bacterium RBG_13_53_10]